MPRAAGCPAGCCLAARGGKSCWCCQGAFAGGQELAQILESISQFHAGRGRAVSAEWGWGLQEHLPFLSLALELAEEPGPWMQQREVTSTLAARLPRAGCMSRGIYSQPGTCEAPVGDSFGVPCSRGLLGLPFTPLGVLVGRGLSLGPVLVSSLLSLGGAR